MNKFTPFVALAGMIALTGCPEILDNTDDTDPIGTVDCDENTFPENGPLSAGDYVDCAPYTGDTIISYFPAPTCSGGTWGYDVELKGTASGVDLYVYDPGGTGADPNQYGDGPHPMADGTTEANGWWDAFDTELDVVTTNPVDGDSTLIDCSKNNGSTLVWGFEALAVDSTDRADCVVVYEDNASMAFLSNFYAYHGLDSCDEVDGWTQQ